jgi:hypothetical protein
MRGVDNWDLLYQLEGQRDAAIAAARAIVAEVKATDPNFPHLAYWYRTWKWLRSNDEQVNREQIAARVCDAAPPLAPAGPAAETADE